MTMTPVDQEQAHYSMKTLENTRYTECAEWFRKSLDHIEKLEKDLETRPRIECTKCGKVQVFEDDEILARGDEVIESFRLNHGCTAERGPYIYRKPVEGEVLEHPFRVPTGGEMSEDTWISWWSGGWGSLTVKQLKNGDIWQPLQYLPPPPELLELAERVRKESNE